MTKSSIFSTLLREPLLHFMLIGAGLFFLFSQMNTQEDTDTPQIIITKAKIKTLTNDFSKIKGRLPTPDEMQTQIKYDIREQVLYHEALAIGLDKEDMIIRNRLAQKMKYIFNDLSLIDDPSDMELEAFIENNPSKFTTPAMLTFSQIYLDPKKHHGMVEEDGKSLLLKLLTNPIEDAINFGDRSLLAYDLKDKRERDIKSIFGDSFAKQAFSSSPKNWEGPIQSAYGIHFIYIHKKTEATIAPLSQIRTRVEEEWISSKQDEANEIFYQSLYKNYKIIVDDEVLKDTNLSSIK